jgi:hypothetical protein
MDCSPDIVRVMNEGGWARLKVLIDKRDTKTLEQSFVFSSSHIDMSKIDNIELDGIGFFSTWPCGICRLVINVLSRELIDMSSWRRLIPNWGVSRGSPPFICSWCHTATVVAALAVLVWRWKLGAP